MYPRGAYGIHVGGSGRFFPCAGALISSEPPTVGAWKKMTARPTRPEKALRFLDALAEEFTAVLNTSSLIQRVLTLLRDEVGFDSCSIGLIEKTRPDVLVLVGTAGLLSSSRGLEIPRPRGFHWLAVETKQPLYVPDAHTDGRQFRHYANIRSVMTAPIIVDEHVIGALGVQSESANAFTPDELLLLTVVAGYLAGALGIARLHEHMQGLSATDPLTKLPNRRYFLEELDRELARSARSGSPVAIALLDLNNFKAINDTFGHSAGDAALIQAADTLRRRLRTTDTLARYGGDEFVALLFATGPRLVSVIMPRLTTFDVTVSDTQKTLTMYWGAASRPTDGTEAEVLLEVADARLYEMKKGVNRRA